MTNRQEPLLLWASAVLRPSLSVVTALAALLMLWWWGIHGVMAPRWSALRHQAQQLMDQQQYEQSIAVAVQKLSSFGRLVAVTEVPLQQLSQQQAALKALDITSSQWRPDKRALVITLRGEQGALFEWWDAMGCSSLLGTVSRWKLQRAEQDDEEAVTLGKAQLEVELYPEPWRWVALLSS